MNEMFAAISGSAVVNAIIVLIVMGIILWILHWAISSIGLPEPFAKVAKVILILFAALVAINCLLTIIGKPLIAWP